MGPFQTMSKDNTFSMDYSLKHVKAFDNAEAIEKCLCLVYVAGGAGIADINGRKTPFVSPCIFCINEREHLVIGKEYDCDISVLFFHPGIINNELNYQNIRNLPEDAQVTLQQDRFMLHDFFERDEGKSGLFLVGPSTGKYINALLETFETIISEQEENWPCRSRSYIMKLLFMLDGLTETTGENNPCISVYDESFLPILQFLYLNYDKKITVEELTNHFHISKSTLASKFKDNLGESFLVYLNKLRVRMAATMLRDTRLPINEIMYRVGFTDAVHFMRTFKKYTNESPSSYREKYCWMLKVPG